VTEEPRITDALIREIRTGHKFYEAIEKDREERVRRQAQDLKGSRTVGALGKLATVLPARDWFLLREKYGDEALNSREFHRDLHRLEPQFKVSSV